MPKLTNNERAPFTDVIKLTADDLKAIGNGGTKVIARIPAGGAIAKVGVLKTKQVAGTSTLVFDVGVSGTAGAFIAALDADNVAVNLPTYNTGTDFVQSVGETTFKAGSLPVRATATAVNVILTVTDAAIASLTAGEFVIGVEVLDLAQFNA